MWLLFRATSCRHIILPSSSLPTKFLHVWLPRPRPLPIYNWFSLTTQACWCKPVRTFVQGNFLLLISLAWCSLAPDHILSAKLLHEWLPQATSFSLATKARWGPAMRDPSKGDSCYVGTHNKCPHWHALLSYILWHALLSYFLVQCACSDDLVWITRFHQILMNTFLRFTMQLVTLWQKKGEK